MPPGKNDGGARVCPLDAGLPGPLVGFTPRNARTLCVVWGLSACCWVPSPGRRVHPEAAHPPQPTAPHAGSEAPGCF